MRSWKNCFSIIVCLFGLTNLVSGETSRIINQLDSIHISPLPHFIASQNVYTIQINNQQDFNKLNSQLSSAISQGYRNISINLADGVFYYKEEHLRLVGIKNNDLAITIKGQNTVLTASGTDYVLEDSQHGGYVGEFSGQNQYGSAYINSAGREMSLLGDVYQAASLVEVVDKQTKLCRLKSPTKLDWNSDMFIAITEWYKGALYPVIKIEDGYVYFTASNLSYSNLYKCYNVNYDYFFSKKKHYPRFQIFNTPLAELYSAKDKLYSSVRTASIHKCNTSRFLYASDLSIGKLEISGISFFGNHETGSLFQFNKFSAIECRISNCQFKYLYNYILLCNSAQNIIFSNNTISNCHYTCLLFDNNCEDSFIENNIFYNNGSLLIQHCCVDCRGKNYYISNNTFCNFSYSAINVGLYYSEKMKNRTCGIVEYNDIYYDEEYLKNPERYTLMDGGAIYITTQNDPAIIRYNKIHDYTGMCANRGIFCDTGSKNVKIYNNTIWNILNSYTIELWYVTEPTPYVPDANSGNFVGNNYLLGNYKFETKKNLGNIQESNIILSTDSTFAHNELSNIDSEAEDVYIKNVTLKKGRIVIPRSNRKQMKSTMNYRKTKKNFSYSR